MYHVIFIIIIGSIWLDKNSHQIQVNITLYLVVVMLSC